MNNIRSKTAPFSAVSSLSMAAAAVVLCAFWSVLAQQPTLPPTIDVPVTFYDFRSDRSNPEFEQPHSGGRRTGMVATTLDADNKPQLGPTPYRNYGIAHWFRDWNTYTAGPYSKGKNMAPVYTPTPGIRQTHDNEWGATVNYLGDQDVGHDTSFKNIVFPGNLVFELANAATGMYEFSRRRSNMFFPLDGRGFGNEWVSVERARNTHNFAFTMELAFEFQVRADMVFNFEGDDDVFVFIDNQLVLELGGIHEPVEGSFNVVNVLGSGAVGSYRTLRVFYAERHSEGSNIWIQTNIVAPPASMDISTVGNSGGGIVTGPINKPADETTTLYSVVYDDNGVVMTPGQYNCDHVTWTVGNTVIGRGCSIVIADSIAGTLNITSTYNDPATPDPPVVKTISMNVRALPPESISIRRTNNPDTLQMLRTSDDIYFNPGQSEATVYAVLRDKYGNYVGLATSVPQGSANDWYTQGQPQWGSEDANVATVNPSSGSSTVVRKEFMGEGTESFLTVSFTVCGGTLTGCHTLTDTVGVGSKSTGAIAVGPPFIPGVTMFYDKFPQNSQGAIRNFYNNVVKNSGSGSGHGVLVAVDAPKQIWNSRGNGMDLPYGQVIIYDAVGNIVKRDVLYRADGAARSYGFIWDGKNEKGRYVGPGTYLVRVSGRERKDDGGAGPSFFVQRKIGVTRAQ